MAHVILICPEVDDAVKFYALVHRRSESSKEPLTLDFPGGAYMKREKNQLKKATYKREKLKIGIRVAIRETVEEVGGTELNRKDKSIYVPSMDQLACIPHGLAILDQAPERCILLQDQTSFYFVYVLHEAIDGEYFMKGGGWVPSPEEDSKREVDGQGSAWMSLEDVFDKKEQFCSWTQRVLKRHRKVIECAAYKLKSHNDKLKWKK